MRGNIARVLKSIDIARNKFVEDHKILLDTEWDNREVQFIVLETVTRNFRSYENEDLTEIIHNNIFNLHRLADYVLNEYEDGTPVDFIGKQYMRFIIEFCIGDCTNKMKIYRKCAEYYDISVDGVIGSIRYYLNKCCGGVDINDIMKRSMDLIKARNILIDRYILLDQIFGTFTEKEKDYVKD